MVMRGIQRLLLAPIILTLAACGGSSKENSGSSTVDDPAYVHSLNLWIDHAEEDLVSAWGVPERSQRLTDGGQALEYRRVNGDGKLLCSTLFTSDVYGRIRTWAYRGSDCRPPRLGDYGAKS
jgi:hypothetical protein